MRVPYFAPTWGRPEEAAVRRALRSGWITMGQEVLGFEQDLAALVGARYAVAVNSATAALHLSLLAAGVQPGEPVVVPVYTFTASAGAILQAGGRPVFADIDPATLNIDPESAADVAPRRVAAWMTVDMAGLPAAYASFRQLKKKRGGALIADAAHSLGAAVGKKAVGALADFTCFSFYANKNLTTAEGGMVTTGNRAADDQLRRLRLHGMSRDAWKRYDKNGSWYYEIDRHGFKYNQNDILAALGRAQLARFEVMQNNRARAAGWYDEGLSDIDEIIPAPRQQGRTHAWHLYVVRLRGRQSKRRNAVIEYLRRKGVGTSVHFIPLCLHPFWKRTFKLKTRDFPHAMAAYQGAISLPMHPGLTRAQCSYVTKTIKDALVKA
jgi:dTDP-4-amino-4,6-dideoxygalactose transaminase